MQFLFLGAVSAPNGYVTFGKEFSLISHPHFV